MHVRCFLFFLSQSLKIHTKIQGKNWRIGWVVVGSKVAQPKKAFAAKPYNLCFIPRTYMAQRENNSESCPLTSLDATACVHAQVTQEDRVVNLSSWHQERIRPLPWQHQKLMVCQNGNRHRFGHLYCSFVFICLPWIHITSNKSTTFLNVLAKAFFSSQGQAW